MRSYIFRIRLTLDLGQWPIPIAWPWNNCPANERPAGAGRWTHRQQVVSRWQFGVCCPSSFSKEFLIETKPRKGNKTALTLAKLPGITDAFIKQVSERNAIIYSAVYLSFAFFALGFGFASSFWVLIIRYQTTSYLGTCCFVSSGRAGREMRDPGWRLFYCMRKVFIQILLWCLRRKNDIILIVKQ